MSSPLSNVSQPLFNFFDADHMWVIFQQLEDDTHRVYNIPCVLHPSAKFYYRTHGFTDITTKARLTLLIPCLVLMFVLSLVI